MFGGCNLTKSLTGQLESGETNVCALGPVECRTSKLVNDVGSSSDFSDARSHSRHSSLADGDGGPPGFRSCDGDGEEGR